MKGIRLVGRAITLIKNAGEVLQDGITTCNKEIEVRDDLLLKYGSEKSELTNAANKAQGILGEIEKIGG